MPEIADRKTFERLKAKLRDDILHDRSLPRAARSIGYEIADHWNFKTGYAWPPQQLLADRTGYCIRTVERAVKVLTGGPNAWFRSEIDSRNYKYFPKLDRSTASDTRQNVGYPHPTFGTTTPDISYKNARQNVGLSSLREPNREPTAVCGQLARRERASSTDDQESYRDRVVATHPDQSEAITQRARRAGAPVFVFENSEPWRAWIAYREATGVPGAMPTRQCMHRGRWRTGWDAPTLYPPGYGAAGKSGAA
jgi:hypothetical protein